MARDYVPVDFQRVLDSGARFLAALEHLRRHVGTITIPAISRALDQGPAISPAERMWIPCMYISRRAMTAIRWLIFLAGSLIILAAASTIAAAVLWSAIGRTF